MGEIRVRFAPSPTGSPHIGNIRTAIYNWLFARKNGGSFILRIEDTDLERSTRKSEEQIMEDLRWLSLNWDEGPEKGGNYGPYRQSERTDLYRRYADRLMEEGRAYLCYCTDEELEQERERQRRAGEPPRYSGRCRSLSEAERDKFKAEGRRPTVRFEVPENRSVRVDDMIRGEVDFESEQIGDFVIIKSDGSPSYNFAVVVDDSLMEISHVIRAEDHLSNTPKQILLYEALGLEPPRFAHAAMILGPDRSPLSKRHGATSVDEFRRRGYLPEAMVNYLSLLGWSPGDDREILEPGELIESFALEDVKKSAAVFDVKKLNWMNSSYIKECDLKRLTEMAVPFLQEAGYLDHEPDEGELSWLVRILELTRDGLNSLADLKDPELVGYFFEYPGFEDEKEARELFAEDGVVTGLEYLREKVATPEDLGPDTVQGLINSTIKELDLGGRRVYHPARMGLTGRGSGPELNHVISILGRKETLSRLDRALEFARKLG